MSRITNYTGIMNYLGGKFLSRPGGLNIVFDDIAERGLLFLEDGSVKNSIGEGMAVRALLPYAKATFLIDNTRTRAAIAEKLAKLAKEAKRSGLAIGVGNAFPETMPSLPEMPAETGLRSRRFLRLSPIPRQGDLWPGRITFPIAHALALWC